MGSGFSRLRWVVAMLILSAPAMAAGVARANVSPALGRWSGSGQGGTVHFVVSRVGGTDVFSDLVEQCAGGTPSAGDIPWSRNKQGPEFRSETAIGANGRVSDGFRSPRVGVTAFDYDVHGTINGDHGTLSVHKSGDGDQSCVIRNAHVSRTGGRTLTDGDYTVSGGAPGTDVELSVFGEGAEVWWSGLFGTPIGGVEDDPEAVCGDRGRGAGHGRRVSGKRLPNVRDARHRAAQRGVLRRPFRRAVSRPRRVLRDFISVVQRRWSVGMEAPQGSAAVGAGAAVAWQRTAAAATPRIATTITRAGPSATWRSETRSRPARECHPTNPGRRPSEITAIARHARIHA